MQYIYYNKSLLMGICVRGRPSLKSFTNSNKSSLSMSRSFKRGDALCCYTSASPARQLGWICSILPDSQLVDVWSPADSAKWGEKLGPSTNVYLTDDGTVCCPRGCCHVLCSTQPINGIHPQRTGGHGTDRYVVLETDPLSYRRNTS